MNQKEVVSGAEVKEKVTFSGLHFLALGFFWQVMWQLNKSVNYAGMLGMSEKTFNWIAIGMVAVTILYILIYMVLLEVKQQIDSKGLFIKYAIGLVMGYAVGKLLALL